MSSQIQARQNSRRQTAFWLILALICLALAGLVPATPAQGNRTQTDQDAERLIKSGLASQEQGRLDEAAQFYQRAIILAVRTPQTAARASLKLGNVYMTQGKFQEAFTIFERATRLDPSNAETLNSLGEALGELKRFPEAIEALNRALALDPTLRKARYNQAVTYDRMGNLRYSEFVFRNLIKNFPDYALGYDGLAVTLSKSGRAQESLPFHERAIALDPKDPSFYYNLAISYLILGNTAKAVEQQEKLKTIDPRVADHLASTIVKRKM